MTQNNQPFWNTRWTLKKNELLPKTSQGILGWALGGFKHAPPQMDVIDVQRLMGAAEKIPRDVMIGRIAHEKVQRGLPLDAEEQAMYDKMMTMPEQPATEEKTDVDG